MRKMSVLSAAIGLLALSACNTSPREQAAENIQANAENTADTLEAAADNTTGAAADRLNNQADAAREMGDKKAEDLRTNDADTNLSNGL